MIVDLHLHNKTVLVIGGGIEGSRKGRGLLDQNCKIIVITNRMNRYLTSLQMQHEISVIKSKLTDAERFLDNSEDLFLLIAATNDRVLNRTLVDKGRQMRAFAYAADDPQYSDFSYHNFKTWLPGWYFNIRAKPNISPKDKNKRGTCFK